MSEKIPKYLELVNWAEQQIKVGKLSPGQKLRSENELSTMFHMSRQTVRHALDVLEKEGVVYRLRGSGTYVNDNRWEYLSKRKQIGIVTTYLDSYIFPRTIKGVEDVLYKKGYAAQISFTNNRWEREKVILENMLKRDEVAGIIIEPTKTGLPNPNLHLYRELIQKKIPVLFINSYYQELDIPHVSMNDVQAGYEATKYLIKKGHQNIGGIFKLDDGQGHKRYEGYLIAMAEEGITPGDENIVWIDTEDIKQMELIADKLMARLRGCTALVVYNDEVTFFLLELLKRRGIYIPKGPAVASIDDSELATLGETKWSSVPHPMEKLGELATLNLMKMIENPRFDGNYEFEVQINERDLVQDIII